MATEKGDLELSKVNGNKAPDRHVTRDYEVEE